MAATKTTEKKTEKKSSSAKKTDKMQETKYQASEFAENAAKVFGANIRSECVMAAFKTEGLEEATVSQAIEIVEKFRKREVK